MRGEQPVAPVPRAAAIGFTLWMAFWVPVILVTSGPQNFWWLCNLAQFLLLIALWTNSVLLISSQAGTVLVVGLVWTVDFVAALLLGGSPFGITRYMFNEELALIQRATSLYHVFLPVLVLWLSARLGYDRRGLWLQCVIGTLAIVGSAVFGDAGRNLNYTEAPFGIEQTWLSDWQFIPLLCIATALLVYVPGHWIIRGLLALRARRRAR
jgi:hypothetical protein